MLRGACYIRVSTENQLENYSIDEQIDRLNSYCKARDILVVKYYTDGGYSGGNTNRPALQQMLRDIEGKNIDTVVVYKLDRLSRSQKDTLMLIEDNFLAYNVDFISVNENFDTSTPFGRAMIGILSVFAQLEKDQITERFTMGRIGRAKNGYFHGGAYAPTGYDYVDGELIVNKYESMQVKILYERFANGYSLYDCWQYMQKHFTTKYGSWRSEALVRNVLKNEVYIGKIKFKGNTYQGNHKPIISEELYSTVQEIFNSSSRHMDSFKRSPFKASTLLASLVYCGNCGARFHGEHGNYSCYSRTKGDKKYIIDPNCKNKKWKIPVLDNLVIKYITNLNFHNIAYPEFKRSEKPDYNLRIKEIDKQMEKLVDLYQIENVPLEIISKKLNALTQEKNLFISEETFQEPERISKSTESRERFLSLLQYGDLSEKRACLTNLIEKIIIHEDDVNIILKHF